MKFIPALAAVVLVCYGSCMQRSARKKSVAAQASGERIKPQKRFKDIGGFVSVFGLWLLSGSIITLIFPSSSQEAFTANVFPLPSNLSIFGYRPSETMLAGWGVMAALIGAAVFMRIAVIPKFTDEPGWLQNIVEIVVETVESYSSERAPYLGRGMYGCIFAIGMTLIGNVLAELMVFRSPSSDLMFTLALSVFVFLMSNWYGIRALSVRGRIKSMSSPSPILLPIRLVTDLANPLSMACRLLWPE